MHRRLKAFEERLARLVRIVRADAIREERERGIRRAREVFAELVREGLRRAGLDPNESPTLCALETPVPPPPPPPRRWRRIDPRETLIEEAQKMAARMREPPSLAHASVMQLFAYYVCGPGARDDPHPAPA